jgi:hypothetical protein
MLIIEVLLVVLLVFLNYSIRIYHYFILREKNELEDKIKGVLFYYIKNSSNPTKKELKFLKRNILEVLEVMEKYEVSDDLLPSWRKLSKYLILKLFYPRGKELYRSWRAYKRYYAARCFQVHFKDSDAHMVIQLINDPVLLVAINAARVAFKYPSPKLINAAIDVLSKERKCRKSIYAAIAKGSSDIVRDIVIKRLSAENNPYVKAFCYRLLMQMPACDLLEDIVEQDLMSDSIELKIAALKYCGYNPQFRHYLGKFIDNEHWELRAIAAEWIGNTLFLNAFPVLEDRLSDLEWWVRIRAAEALAKFGQLGVDILRAQSPQKDQYAFDAAQEVLSSYTDEIPHD